MRMRRCLVSLVVLLVMLPAAAAAQGGSVNPACSDPAFVGPTLQGGNPCQILYDMFGYGTQQYVSVVSAGNQEIGRADALGGWLKWRVGMELTGATFDVPAIKEQGSGVALGPAFPQAVPMTGADYIQFAVNGALGLFKGLDLGGLRLGAVDAIGGFNVLPGTTAGGYKMSAAHKIYFSYGGRVGVIQEGKVIPALGFTYVVKDLPTMTLIASDVLQNTIAVSQLKMNTSAWTVTVGKHFGIVSLVAGGGQTKYDASGLLMWSVNGVNPTVSPPITATSTQTDYFGDFGVDLGSNVLLTVEYGGSSGGQIQSFNTFDPPPNSFHSFLTAAISIGR
jgi:hypothetical protein